LPFPSWPLSATRQVLIRGRARKLLFEFLRQVSQRNADFDGFSTTHRARAKPHVPNSACFLLLQARRKGFCEPRKQLGGCSERFLQVKGYLCRKQEIVVEPIDAVAAPRAQDLELNEILQILRIDPEDCACLL